MTMDRHDTIVALLDEYALGQLSDNDRRDVEAHVLECDVCAADLHELSAVIEGIAHSIAPVTPPPALKQRVLAALPSVPQEQPRGSSAAVEPIRPPVKTLDARRGVHPAWLAAAALVILGIGTLLYLNAMARQRLVDDVRRAEATASELQRRLADNAAQADLAVAILTANDMRPIAMAGRENATGSAARAYWSPTRGLLVVADRLPVPPPGRIYQVWLIGGNQPVSAGLLGEQGSGRGMLIAPPPSGLPPGAVTVAVTDEPPGGLAAPTGSIRLAGSSS
jgi:anti-sigma factor RsiW